MTRVVAPGTSLFERDGTVVVISSGRMDNGLRTEVRPVWTVQLGDPVLLLDAVLSSLAAFRQSMPPQGSEEYEALIFRDQDLKAALGGVRTDAQMRREVRRISIIKLEDGFKLRPSRAHRGGAWEGLGGGLEELVSDPAELPAAIIRTFNKCE